MVVIPSVAEEDLRRSHRERDRLVRERTAHINRIKGLLFGPAILILALGVIGTGCGRVEGCAVR